MKKNFKVFWLPLLAGMLIVPNLEANEKERWHIGGGVTSANDSLKKATNKTPGLGLTIGLDRMIGDTNVGFRPSFGINWLSGKEKADGSKLSLTNLQVASDLLIPTGTDSVQVVTGISLNQWRYIANPSREGVKQYGISGSGAPRDIKFGFRIGVDVKVSERFTADLMLQMVEMGNFAHNSKANWDNLSPTWLQVGVRYHF